MLPWWFDVLANSIFYAFEKVSPSFLAEVEVAVVLHVGSTDGSRVVSPEVIQQHAGQFDDTDTLSYQLQYSIELTAFANDVFEGCAFLAGDALPVAHLV